MIIILLGTNAFYQCFQLTSVAIPSSVTVIGNIIIVLIIIIIIITIIIIISIIIPSICLISAIIHSYHNIHLNYQQVYKINNVITIITY